MIRRFKRMSLSQKLAIFILGMTLLTLVIPSVWMGIHYMHSSRQQLLRDITVLSQVVGDACADALRSGSREDAERTLASLATVDHIKNAQLYGPKGGLVAGYARSLPRKDGAAEVASPDTSFSLTRLAYTHRILVNGEQAGTLIVNSDMSTVQAGLRSSFRVLLAAAAVSCVLALIFTYFYLRFVSRPLLSLMDTATRISETGDYQLRAEKFNDDDLGKLTDRFNQMIGQVQQRDEALLAAQARLENGLEQIRSEQWEVKEARDREESLREQLSRSERMESLGLLAGGVAHDLNNILGPVVGYPDLILHDLEPEHPVRDDIVEIQKAAIKAAAVIQDLLTLGRRGSYDKQPVDLNRVVSDYLSGHGFHAMMEQHAKIQFQKELAAKLPPIEGSMHHLTQVVMNLVVNAAEAMDGEGTLALWTRRSVLSVPFEGTETVPPGEYVELCVRDTGAGISKEDLGHIFEPFYTRKKLGRCGSGLGLAVVYGVVKDLDGFIDVRSRPGEGTRFRLFFPLSSSEAVVEEESGSDVGGSERILIVDDVEEQRNLATRILRSLGYATDTACNGREGIEKIREGGFDLVLLDMIMEKDFDGLDAFRGMREIHPGQRCIIASGFSESHRVSAAQSEGAGAFVPKPYTRSKLARAVRKELDRVESDVSAPA